MHAFATLQFDFRKFLHGPSKNRETMIIDPPEVSAIELDINPPKRKPSPVGTVLSIYKLLEKILLNLSTQQLAGMQRVSRTWQNVINRSQALQNHMFLMRTAKALMPLPDLDHKPWPPEYDHPPA